MRRAHLLLLAAVLAAPGEADGFCLRLQVGGGPAATLPAAVGETLRLSFRHSLYGSEVQEDFRLTTEGLQLVRLRYAERRLVEFYGHEAARWEAGWWTVATRRPPQPRLALRVGPESSLQLSLGLERELPLAPEAPGALVEVAVSPCPGRDDAPRRN